MASTPRTVVLLPTYNERENIGTIVPQIRAVANVDVMILDDNSPDGTGKVADELALSDSRVCVIHRPKKEGLGRAYLDGMRRALDENYDLIIEMDADFSHPPQLLPRLITAASEVDLVLGSRNVTGGGTKNWPLWRRLLSKSGSFYARSLLGVDVQDLTGGYKCFRRIVLENIDLNSIHSNGYAFQIETTYRALMHGFRVLEIPFIFVERACGQSKMSQKIFFEAIMMCPYLRFTQIIHPRSGSLSFL